MRGCGTRAAQPDAALEGRVRDATGAVVPRAVVRAGTAPRGAASSTVTDNEGRYRFARLAPGSVAIQVNAPGFAPFLAEGVTLAAGAANQFDIVLAIGPVRHEVTVTPVPEDWNLHTSTKNHQDVLEIGQVRESAAKDVGEALAHIDGLWKIRKGASPTTSRCAASSRTTSPC